MVFEVDKDQLPDGMPLEVGIEVVAHISCRDRNIIGLQSDFLGAAALGAGGGGAGAGDCGCGAEGAGICSRDGGTEGDGIDIARRTVAKYREALGIASSVQRRREKQATGA